MVISLLFCHLMTFDSDRPFARTAPLVAASVAMRELQKEAELAARVDVRVLIAGEYGVGKRRLARLIHAESSRHRGPFVSVRCGRDPETRLHARLFGGGNSSSRIRGAFDRADGGTILLQDVDALTPALQDALIGYLATGRAGAADGRALDVQILTSTKVPLIDKVGLGAFRNDLYYLLNTMYLPIPPLRERPEDIEPLLEHFTTYYARRYGIGRPRLTSEWYAQYRAYAWPSNVRELQTMVATLVAQAAQSFK